MNAIAVAVAGTAKTRGTEHSIENEIDLAMEEIRFLELWLSQRTWSEWFQHYSQTEWTS
jgi:hypothetical protein